MVHKFNASYLLIFFAFSNLLIAAEQFTPDKGKGKDQDQGITDSVYLLELAQIHLRHNSLGRAEPLLRTALESAKDAVQRRQVASILAALLQRKSDFKAAAELYEQLIKSTAPADKFRSQLQLANCYAQLKLFDKAEQILTDAQAATDNTPATQYQRQEIQRYLVSLWQQQPGRLDMIVQQSEDSVKVNPNDVTSIERLADLYSTAKPDPVKAGQCFDKLLVLKPDDKAMQRRVLGVYQQSQQYDKAAALAQRMIASATTKDESRSIAIQAAQLMLMGGKREEAATWLKQNFPDEGAVGRDYAGLAGFYEQAGMTADAEAALQKSIELAKSREEKANAQIRIAEFAIRRGEQVKAEEILKNVIKENSDDTGLLGRANGALTRIQTAK